MTHCDTNAVKFRLDPALGSASSCRGSALIDSCYWSHTSCGLNVVNE